MQPPTPLKMVTTTFPSFSATLSPLKIEGLSSPPFWKFDWRFNPSSRKEGGGGGHTMSGVKVEQTPDYGPYKKKKEEKNFTKLVFLFWLFEHFVPKYFFQVSKTFMVDNANVLYYIKCCVWRTQGLVETLDQIQMCEMF